MRRRWLVTLGIGGAAAGLSVPEVRYLRRLTAISASLRDRPEPRAEVARPRPHGRARRSRSGR
jgi:hypothetical protein